ncbi:hypothetical protein LTR27_005556 [Elasticomyces elasticus]|nr:hypothetical protein LTR27_005556 [Elasticomyces elasticus]
MASPPPPLTFSDLSTDIMFMIFDLLPTADLCELRLVSHRAENESFKCFACRAYKHIEICESHRSMLHLAQVFHRNHALASTMKTLSVRWLPDANVELSQPSCYSPPTWPTSAVLAVLPELEKLELHGMTDSEFGPHFHLQQSMGVDGKVRGVPPGTGWPLLKSLSIKASCLTHRNLMAFFRLVSPALLELHVEEVQSLDGHWVRILFAMLASSNLRRLRLRDLGDEVWRRGKDSKGKDRVILYDRYFTFQDVGVTISRTLDGQLGTERLCLQHREASMEGAEAIKEGLDMVAKHVAAEEEAWRRESQGF